MSQQEIKVAVGKMVEAATANPKSGQFKYKVSTNWENDVRTSAKIRNFPELTVDEPPPFGGSDLGPSPVELVLAALGTCQEIMYAALASAMDIPLEKCKVDLEGDLDVRGLLGLGAEDNIPPGFTQISYKTSIESPASEEQLQQLADAVNQQCPVLDMLLRNVEVTKDVVINGASTKAA
ncbi:MAG: OsmC family protein [Gammaproteobacteria bacterium]